MAAGEQPLSRHPSLDDRFDPAIRIVAHDPGWAPGARREIRRIGLALGPLAIAVEHVGSTAVPGVAAKAIIDLQLSVAEVGRRRDYLAPLKELGYLFIGDPASPDFHFFARPAARPRSHHLHVCQAGSAHELRHLAVRDFLRAHPQEAYSYEQLKRRLAAEQPQDRLAYIAGKGDYVDRLESRALAWWETRTPPGADG